MAETHSQNRRLGYARVSTYGQTLDTQLEQLRSAGCTKIFREKVTGAHNDRRELLKMLKGLAPGDVVTVTRIDRLARSTFDLFAIVKQIVDAKAQFADAIRAALLVIARVFCGQCAVVWDRWRGEPQHISMSAERQQHQSACQQRAY
jgi:hypothetical protein